MAESKRDYYEVPSVSKDVDGDVLKKAYRKLAEKYHPDANPGDKATEAKLEEVSEIYSVLSDPQKRQQYDQFDHAASEQDGTGAGGFGGGFGGFDFDGDIDDIFGDIFGDTFDGGRSEGARSGPSRGTSIGTPVGVTFEEAVSGCDKGVEINFRKIYASCHGTSAKVGTSPQIYSECSGKGKTMYTRQSFFGTIQNVQTCLDCNGTGQVIKGKYPDCYGTDYKTVRKEFRVPIPVGTDNGQCVRLAGGGEPSMGSGEHGDLLVEVVVSRHPIFKRQDAGTYSMVPVSFARAALGGPIRIKIVDGEVKYDVRSGTQTDTKARLKGKGIPSLCSRSVRGDRYVILMVQVPERTDQAQKEALRRLDDAVNGVTSQEEGRPKKKGILE